VLTSVPVLCCQPLCQNCIHLRIII